MKFNDFCEKFYEKLKKLKTFSRAARAETLGPCGIAKLLAIRVTHCIGTVDALHRQMNAAGEDEDNPHLKQPKRN